MKYFVAIVVIMYLFFVAAFREKTVDVNNQNGREEPFSRKRAEICRPLDSTDLRVLPRYVLYYPIETDLQTFYRAPIVIVNNKTVTRVMKIRTIFFDNTVT